MNQSKFESDEESVNESRITPHKAIRRLLSPPKAFKEEFDEESQIFANAKIEENERALKILQIRNLELIDKNTKQKREIKKLCEEIERIEERNGDMCEKIKILDDIVKNDLELIKNLEINSENRVEFCNSHITCILEAFDILVLQFDQKSKKISNFCDRIQEVCLKLNNFKKQKKLLTIECQTCVTIEKSCVGKNDYQSNKTRPQSKQIFQTTPLKKGSISHMSLNKLHNLLISKLKTTPKFHKFSLALPPNLQVASPAPCLNIEPYSISQTTQFIDFTQTHQEAILLFLLFLIILLLLFDQFQSLLSNIYPPKLKFTYY